MKKKLSKTDMLRREVREMREDVVSLRLSYIDMSNILVDIAYLLAPVVYDTRTRGKYPAKSMRRVDDLIKKNKRGDMTKLERAFWTGEEVD